VAPISCCFANHAKKNYEEEEKRKTTTSCIQREKTRTDSRGSHSRVNNEKHAIIFIFFCWFERGYRVANLSPDNFIDKLLRFLLKGAIFLINRCEWMLYALFEFMTNSDDERKLFEVRRMRLIRTPHIRHTQKTKQHEQTSRVVSGTAFRPTCTVKANLY
jgi:hypothetical protein